jgi:hypothetical protein
MQPSAAGAFLAMFMAATAAPATASGQWSVAVEVGSVRFWGGSVENTPEHRSLRPYRPTTFGARFERQSGRLGLGLRFGFTEASLALEGGDAIAAVKGVFTIYGASPEISYRIASVGPGNHLLLHAGPLLEVWSLIDEESRTRIGIQGAVSLGIPLGGRFAGSLAAGAALSPSPFKEGELDPTYELRALWRRSVAARLEYRL